MKNGAIISDCQKYRFQLWRIWDESKPFVMFVMMNPSTADANEDDPTIRRCIGFAKSWGYGGIYVGNISPFRATDPKTLIKSKELFPIGHLSNIWEMIEKCKLHVLAHGKIPFKHPDIKFMGWKCLGQNKDGSPKHPLYLKSNTMPVNYES